MTPLTENDADGLFRTRTFCYSSIHKLKLEHAEESNMFRFMLENHHEPVYLAKLDDNPMQGKMFGFNYLLCELLGYTLKELVVLNHSAIFAPESLPLVERSLKKTFTESNVKWEGLLMHKNGQRIPVEVKSYIFNRGQHALLFVFLRDISYYKQSVRELRNHQSLLERAESIGQMGFWELDMQRNKVWASHGARKIYGLKEQEITMDDFRKLPLDEYHPMLTKAMRELIAQGSKCDVEFKMKRSTDGAVVYIRSMAEYDAMEKRVYGIVQDVSQQKRAEQELIAARRKAEESDRLKTAFLHNMSHEIRTPMNGILGFAELLVESKQTKQQTEYKEIIQRSCDHLLDTIDNILDMARIQSGQIKLTYSQVNIHSLINDIFEEFLPLAIDKDLVLRLAIDNIHDACSLSADLDKLKTILGSLTDNAIRFTHKGFVEIGGTVSDTAIELYVKDTGVGIQPKHHEIIFQPFCHADYNAVHTENGAGLGLTITKAYVEMMNGNIRIDSDLDMGTTFYVGFPLIHTPHKHVPHKNSIARNKWPKTCLVVEDLEINYVYLKAMLQNMGFNVLWAKDGNQAITLATTNNEIDMVLMDIRLPHTDGYEATRIIKKKRPWLPIIAQTANALPDEKNKALDSGCDDYITKPIYRAAFETLINSYLV